MFSLRSVVQSRLEFKFLAIMQSSVQAIIFSSRFWVVKLPGLLHWADEFKITSCLPSRPTDILTGVRLPKQYSGISRWIFTNNSIPSVRRIWLRGVWTSFPDQRRNYQMKLYFMLKYFISITAITANSQWENH